METSIILKNLQQIRSEEWNTKAKIEICDYVESLFENTWFFIERFEKNWIYSITISSKNTRKVDFLFSWHLDVVPSDEQTWEYKEDEEYFYWRWTLDMKWGCAVMISSFLENKEILLNSEKSFLLMFTTDEELWWENWVQYLVNEEWFEAKMVYIPDTWAWMDKYLKTGKWFLFWEIEINGKDAHWCRPWRWLNSIDTFVKVYEELYKEFPKAENDEDWWKNISINIWKINGWQAPNQVMSKLTFTVDLRFHPENSLDFIREKLNKVFSRFENISFNEKIFFAWFQVDLESEYVKKYLEIISEFYDEKIIDEKEYGSNDGRFFTHLTKDIIMTWPFGYGYHWANERVSKSEINNFKEIFTKYLEKLA